MNQLSRSKHLTEDLQRFWIERNNSDDYEYGRPQMLFAEQGTNSLPWWIAGLSIVGPVIGAAAVFVWNKYKESRKDTIQEWRDITNAMREDLDKLQVELKETKANHALEMTALTTRIGSYQEKLHECELSKVKMEGTVQLLQDNLRRLQVKHRDVSPPSVLPGMIVANIEGIVHVISPVITAILHWMPNDLVGQNIKKIIPKRFQEAHEIGLAKMKETDKPPWTTKSIVTKALTKEGTEVDVSIALSGWQTRSGDWMINAEIALLPDPDDE